MVKNAIVVLLTVIAAVSIGLIFIFYSFFSAPQIRAEAEWFVVPQKTERDETIAKLYGEGFIKSRTAMNAVLYLNGVGDEVRPGGYSVSKSMNVFKIAAALNQAPDQKWVVLWEGMRKEEMAELLAKSFKWDEKNLNDFINAYDEGVYFPDTYLVPKNESGKEMARRMFNRFNEKITSYTAELTEQNIRLDTTIKIASLIQREASGKEDARLISGIIWNRLLVGMKLDIDATIQYALGNAENGWWPTVRSEDRRAESPYNTYLNAGLPPAPIANPGINSIEAVLFPEKTDCLFYIHANRQTYCSATYDGHLDNIKRYLR
ncbi:hypothetical protein A3A20_02315 [Candidatus Wolfebacteria bacterium RIFCSPLOWO2_01_FULL_45_19]|uniref:Endolytic murein transglycosylase n=1 Tax=Candidatus Wolfebacteria bacterium RIFCSPLOWO2_01_FULL_45_19 TaxID=1802557 RepID=A0A1F8DVD5_9BACT|nr:MAG: Aminodeoxychorismate lyase [Parcubacteria group bacterium GW2011_GWB1_45_9]OGM91745.1 MAG: hypothetical protein A3A20_02315 [Candidatus Wolfebacteria bacterium RIFCSPLOWO2_01_FULL_45_19]